MTRPHVVTLLSLLLIAASACQSKEENPSNPPLELTDMAEAQSYSAIEAGAPERLVLHVRAEVVQLVRLSLS